MKRERLNEIVMQSEMRRWKESERKREGKDGLTQAGTFSYLRLVEKRESGDEKERWQDRMRERYRKKKEKWQERKTER